MSTSPPIGGHGAHSNALPLSSMKDQNSSSTPHGDTVSSFSGLPTPGMLVLAQFKSAALG